MNLITKTSAAVLVAALGFAAVAPAALAQDAGPQAGPGFGPRHELMFRGHDGDGDGPRMMMRGEGGPGGMRGGMFHLACSEQGAERLEHVFVSLSHRLELTDEQTPLFDALKTAALTAQTGFADTCAAQLPATGQTAEAPSLVERVQTGLKIDEARIAAMTEVLPELEAFYNSLTDEQKAQLDAGPRALREHFGKRQGGPGFQHFQHRPMMDQNG